ncbi:pyruvate kinase [Buchnera aphidicola (Nipponaphis monzeni)]|uniref:Pyruvate kinase n=1 Tax=Buchnera aphidicola (Nipponaphis monzeni) TaxID=2495405 RepID=A0A455TAE3_9GAMM|nr:pyruvate kinase [Buchnera aphidicola]BBI01260.1 pyruvate kinase [Buchnera aphidicola (Nipponaphis monzeni)]
MIIRRRRTKIIATLGPATDSLTILEQMMKSGVNVLRLNFSHGSTKDHYYRAKKVIQIRKKLNCHIALLGDLQGPKIRISKFENDRVFLKKGQIFILDNTLNNSLGNAKMVGTNYKNLPNDVYSKDILLLDDGKIQLKIEKVINNKIFTKVLIGGYLSNNKGINKLGGGLSANSITDKDKKDILTAINIGVDYLAVSFPRSAKDIEKARKLIHSYGCNAKIIAKIERAEAVSNETTIKEIIVASDAIMVARGDLGIEVGEAELAGIQKNLIKKARQLNRVVITATQMMESMILNPFPTRAEVMDVANAVLDGSDAVMLSGETASGKYPIETIQTMQKICKGAEKMPSINISRHRLNEKFNNIEEVIAMSVMYAANHLQGISAIVTMTESGRTALMTSRISSGLPIFALSKNQNTLKLTSLYRGVIPVYFKNEDEGLLAAHKAIDLLLSQKFLSKGNLVIFTQGDKIGAIGKTNSSRILQVK